MAEIDTPDGGGTLIRRVRLPGGRPDGEQDVLVDDGRLTQVVLTGQLPVPAGARVVDAGGRYCLPGLWDEHTHMVQWALAMSRLDVSVATSAAHAADLVRAALGNGGRPVVGYGFRDALWPDTPTRDLLDGVAGQVPAVLVAADLHCAWLNTAAGRLLAADVPADGIVREGAWFDAMGRLDEETAAGAEVALAAAMPLLPERGVVGVVDLEGSGGGVDNIANWHTRMAGGEPLVRVEAGIYPDRLSATLAEGWRSGQVVPGTGGMLRVGPLKILSDGSLNTRTALCRDPYYAGAGGHGGGEGGGEQGFGYREYDVDQIAQMLTRADGGGITSTVHAIGDLAVGSALDAFERTGLRGRIEHAQLIHPDDVSRFAALGVVASVQPEHAMDDRDVAEEYWPDRTGWCFPLASLHAAGATLRLGSDAPVAPLDPWATISAAVTRSRDGRQPWHPEQAIDAATALAASTRGQGHVRPGQPADLVLTETDPHTADGETLRTMPVWATMLAGRWTHSPG